MQMEKIGRPTTQTNFRYWYCGAARCADLVGHDRRVHFPREQGREHAGYALPAAWPAAPSMEPPAIVWENP